MPKLPKTAHERVLTTLKTLVAPSLFEILKRKAYDLEIPVSRLIAIALDNELDSTVPFTYSLAEPTTPFREHEHLEEAQKIMKFLGTFGIDGASLDTLMLCRRDIGIENKEQFLLGWRELKNMPNVIVEFRPKLANFHYSKDYRRWRLSTQKDAEKLK